MRNYFTIYTHCVKEAKMEKKNEIINIRKLTGLNRKEFAEYFSIPYRTISDWELGNRTPPEYLIKLLRYQVLMEKLQPQKTMLAI